MGPGRSTNPRNSIVSSKHSLADVQGSGTASGFCHKTRVTPTLVATAFLVH